MKTKKEFESEYDKYSKFTDQKATVITPRCKCQTLMEQYFHTIGKGGEGGWRCKSCGYVIVTDIID